jgi:hypothetical protein
LYSSVRVSISILSPMLDEGRNRQFETGGQLGRLHTLPEVSPLTAGSV